MAISDKINKLRTDITSAYNAIQEKGGTIPDHKNTNNLSTAILSISTGDTLETIDDTGITALTAAYVKNWQTHSGLTDKQKMEFVITWLRDRNYIK